MSFAMLNSTDEELIKEVSAGKREAFSVIVERYDRLCFHYFIKVMSINFEDAADLTQEAFTRAFKSLHTFSVDRRFKPWLMAICRNLAMDHFSSVKPAHVNAVANSITIDHSERTILCCDLESAIQKLTQRQQEVLEMHYFWSLTCAEIAEILGMPDGTVKSDLFYARKRLLDLLEEI